MQDVLNEVERNLHDAMGVARNVAMDPRLVPGGGAVEMAVSRALNDKASTVSACSRMHACLRLNDQSCIPITHQGTRLDQVLLVVRLSCALVCYWYT